MIHRRTSRSVSTARLAAACAENEPKFYVEVQPPAPKDEVERWDAAAAKIAEIQAGAQSQPQPWWRQGAAAWGVIFSLFALFDALHGHFVTALICGAIATIDWTRVIRSRNEAAKGGNHHAAIDAALVAVDRQLAEAETGPHTEARPHIIIYS